MSVGKRVGRYLYVHREALPLIGSPFAEQVALAFHLCPAAISANVLKIDDVDQIITALLYPNFFENPFPALQKSWTIHLTSSQISFRSYEDSSNPPILHRKELLISTEHPDRYKFEQLTAQAEALGLFSDNHRIGFARAWERVIERAGYYLHEYSLLPLSNEINSSEDIEENHQSSIERHRTALCRSSLSAPVQALLRYELLTLTKTFFDYGCGRGNDIRQLQLNGYLARGWDPYYANTESHIISEVVNLGFVLNVIEDCDERVEVLKAAYGLTKEVLSVAVMLYGSVPPTGQPYRDGYRTQRNTFQRYYTQIEFKNFVESILKTDAIAVGPGLFFVFVNKITEQRFLFERQRSKFKKFSLNYYKSAQSNRLRTPRIKVSRLRNLIVQYQAQLNTIWELWVELGREPQEDQVEEAPSLSVAFGNWRRVLKITYATQNKTQLEHAIKQRKDDLIVYLSLRLFEKQKAYKQIEIGLQRDIKEHFGTYANAMVVAVKVLKDVANIKQLDEAAKEASERGLGYYSPREYLQIDAFLVSRLPVLLRIYIGCGCVLYGDLNGIDVIKIHLRSGKLSL